MLLLASIKRSRMVQKRKEDEQGGKRVAECFCHQEEEEEITSFQPHQAD